MYAEALREVCDELIDSGFFWRLRFLLDGSLWTDPRDLAQTAEVIVFEVTVVDDEFIIEIAPRSAKL